MLPMLVKKRMIFFMHRILQQVSSESAIFIRCIFLGHTSRARMPLFLLALKRFTLARDVCPPKKHVLLTEHGKHILGVNVLPMLGRKRLRSSSFAFFAHVSSEAANFAILGVLYAYYMHIIAYYSIL